MPGDGPLDLPSAAQYHEGMPVTPPLCASCGQPASEALAGPEHGWECRNEACPEFGQSIDANEPGREPELATWRAPLGDRILNHPSFEVLLYSGVEAAAAGADSARALFARHGWRGAWVDGIFDFHHFHSTSHEALAVVAGRATVELGGPQGRAFDVSEGDVLVLPAGTGHRRASSGRGFTVVGAYPAGQEDYDLLRGDDPAQLEAARRRIAALGAPPHDPVGGEGIARWR